ncbi:hypothetical protein [Bifidobacterium callimiconis]|uniref:Rhamnogalacturonan acetylesterase rhgT n=1 Tax=Bifidobacterium callimiconis TaxID=2306973 RepID=A0A430FGE0_9BIFI|nr:hypothetical protein [Bifidobacterium callimiconis]MBT1176664.1 hypothetical protein [Bifidobacterium callimiconis]RSX51880.1 Rhamnogalacturonan acetylesterase rhgT [Bifidobacterium callimiconis]
MNSTDTTSHSTTTSRATIWAVGDSTVSAFNDVFYIPRVGYGEALSRYFDAEVINLARSGSSSTSFTALDAYHTLLNGDPAASIPALGTRPGHPQFLLIAFGHNDEKADPERHTDPNGDRHTPGSFAWSLTEHYILPALERGVRPVLCTPIARLNANDNTANGYLGTCGHITDDGDYAQAVRDLAAALNEDNIPVDLLDMTRATIDLNIGMGADAQWLHAFGSARPAATGTPDTAGTHSGELDGMRPIGLDPTHTNLFGASMHAWLVARLAVEQHSAMAGLVRQDVERPTYEHDFPESINPTYVIPEYTPPQTSSTRWPLFRDADGRIWQGSAFGNLGVDPETSTDFDATACGTEDSPELTLKVAGNRGKIAGNDDGFLMYFTQLPSDAEFTLTATATLEAIDAANEQVSYGLMVRDDMLIDCDTPAMMGDYVATGYRFRPVTGFGRRGGTLISGPAATRRYGTVGERVRLEIHGTEDGYTLRFGDNPAATQGFDYRLTTVDPEHVYVGFFVTRNATVTFGDVRLRIVARGRSADEPRNTTTQKGQ